MNILFTPNGWDDYTYWETQEKKTLRRVNMLLKDICRNGNTGIGKPEPLSGDLSGFWSRRINETDRLIYRLDDDNIYVISCRFHYSDH